MKKQTIEVDVPDGYIVIKNNVGDPFPYSFIKEGECTSTEPKTQEEWFKYVLDRCEQKDFNNDIERISTWSNKLYNDSNDIIFTYHRDRDKIFVNLLFWSALYNIENKPYSEMQDFIKSMLVQYVGLSNDIEVELKGVEIINILEPGLKSSKWFKKLLVGDFNVVISEKGDVLYYKDGKLLFKKTNQKYRSSELYVSDEIFDKIISENKFTNDYKTSFSEFTLEKYKEQRIVADLAKDKEEYQKQFNSEFEEEYKTKYIQTEILERLGFTKPDKDGNQYPTGVKSQEIIDKIETYAKEKEIEINEINLNNAMIKDLSDFNKNLDEPNQKIVDYIESLPKEDLTTKLVEDLEKNKLFHQEQIKKQELEREKYFGSSDRLSELLNKSKNLIEHIDNSDSSKFNIDRKCASFINNQLSKFNNGENNHPLYTSEYSIHRMSEDKSLTNDDIERFYSKTLELKDGVLEAFKQDTIEEFVNENIVDLPTNLNKVKPTFTTFIKWVFRIN